MEKVYRARDTKLGYEVAGKILHWWFAANPMRLGRFERDAHLLAALNHPKIPAICGFDDSGSVKAWMMELVERPTQAGRIAVALDNRNLLAKLATWHCEASY